MNEPPPLPPPPIVRVRDLRRTFRNVQAVAGVTFDVHPGQVVGFIGANGAGKTTTMRIMATLDTPSSGRVEVCGLNTVDYPIEVRRRIGWMPDAYGTYDNMTVFEYLDFYGRAFGYRHKERASRVAEVMDFTDLNSIRSHPMNKLSKGMAQRLCLGRTLLHDPELLILDEPAAGLDPRARVDFKHLVRLLAAEGKTIFISSHILSELGEMCDTLLFIDHGRIVHHGSAESLQQHTAGNGIVVTVQVRGDPGELVEWAALQRGVSCVEVLKRGARLRLEEEQVEALFGMLRQMIVDGIEVIDFHREERRLEDAFVEMLKC